MYINDHNLCIGCMQPLDQDGGCSFCGLKQDEYSPIPRCLTPGTELSSRYVTGKVLGEGSFGITYMGWDKFMDIPVAIKEYFPSDMVSRDVICGSGNDVYLYESGKKQDYDEYLKKFLEEARCLSRFNQVEGIVSVLDFFYENNTAYLVMQYIDGISVKEQIYKKGKLSAKQVVEAMRPVLLALEQIHSTGIVHRDISPDNLMIKKDGGLVLIDFGAARMRNIDNTKTMTVMFKRGFSPEEQYRYRGKWDSYTDVYSICATMYFMMTGTAPVDSVIRALGDDMPSLISMKDLSISMKQRKAIMKGMAVTAKNRWQTMGELCQALYEEEMNGIPKTGRSKYRKIVATAATMILVGTIGLGVAHGFSSKNSQKVVGNKDVAEVVSTSAVASTDSETGGTPEPAASPSEPTQAPIIQVDVPKVTGLRVAAAKKKLKQLGLKYKVKRVEHSKATGIVVKQSVRAGKKVEEGTKVTLTVSKGLPLTPAPTRAPVTTTTRKSTTKKPEKKNSGFAGVIQ